MLVSCRDQGISPGCMQGDQDIPSQSCIQALELKDHALIVCSCNLISWRTIFVRMVSVSVQCHFNSSSHTENMQLGVIFYFGLS